MTPSKSTQSPCSDMTTTVHSTSLGSAVDAWRYAESFRISSATVKQRILLVEPDAAISHQITVLLTANQRYDLDVAKDGREAVRICELRAPDLLITALELPEAANGAVLAQYIREITRKQLPAIILEYAAPGQDGGLAHKKNALHMAKPLKLRSLLHCVVHLLRYQPS